MDLDQPAQTETDSCATTIKWTDALWTRSSHLPETICTSADSPEDKPPAATDHGSVDVGLTPASIKCGWS